MSRYRLSLAYDGSHFSGWAVQPGQRTVQGVLGEILKTLFCEEINVTAAGRTDAGVHALCQTVHVDLETSWNNSQIAYRINAILPDDIILSQVQNVAEDFHSRYSCLAKQYIYRVANTPTPPLFERDFVSWERRPLSLVKIREAAKDLEGEHDFKSFMNVGREVDTSVRKVYRVRVKRSHGEIIISVLGAGFLYNQVRIMAGTLINVGLEKTKPEDVKMIRDSLDRSQAGQTAHAKGLCLNKTIYKGDKSEGMLP
jgi:tRNA pseudouridine38-40 synthase